MKIEKMKRSDLETATRLGVQLGYESSLRDFEQRFFEIEKKSDYALFVAKSSENEVVGWIQINAEPMSLLIGPRADVGALVVDEKHRGQGIGKALLNHAEEWAKENKLPFLRIRSNAIREEAHRFYKREGYTLSKSWNVFIKQLDK